MGLCQVTIAGSGKRADLAPVATPPKVDHRVAGVERAVARVEEREVAGGVAGGGVDLERADPVAALDRPGRPRLRAGDTALELGLGLVRVDGLVAGQQPRVARGDEDLDPGQRGGERVEAADVVLVGVGQRDPLDRLPERGGGGQDPPGGAGDQRVDEGEAVLLLDEIAVDEPEAVDLVNRHS